MIRELTLRVRVTIIKLGITLPSRISSTHSTGKELFFKLLNRRRCHSFQRCHPIKALNSIEKFVPKKIFKTSLASSYRLPWKSRSRIKNAFAKHLNERVGLRISQSSPKISKDQRGLRHLFYECLVVRDHCSTFPRIHLTFRNPKQHCL